MISAEEALKISQAGPTLNHIATRILEAARDGKREIRVNAPLADTVTNHLINWGYDLEKCKSYYIIKW